jgi:hypothetical protein
VGHPGDRRHSSSGGRKAGQYDAEVEADRTAKDWIAFMRDSDLERAVDAWNWAIGYVDSTHWDQENPYKMDP